MSGQQSFKSVVTSCGNPEQTQMLVICFSVRVVIAGNEARVDEGTLSLSLS